MNHLLRGLITDAIPEAATGEESIICLEGLHIRGTGIGPVETHFGMGGRPRGPSGSDVGRVDTSVGVKESSELEERASEGDLEVVVEVLAVSHSVGSVLPK